MASLPGVVTILSGMSSDDQMKDNLNTFTHFEPLTDEDFRPRAYYNGLVNTGKGRTADCIACGQCESVCPQHLEIISLMKEAAENLDV